MGGEGPATAEERQRRRRAAIAAVALSVAAFGFAAYASSAGSVHPVVQGDGGWRWDRDPSPPPPRPRELEVEPAEPRELEPTVAGDVLSGFAQFLVVAAIAGAVALLVHRSFRYARRIRLAPRVDADDWDVVPADARQEVGDAATTSLDAVRAGGEVRDVVIACWLALEAAAGRAGIERAPSETASELTVRVLGGLAVPPAAVRRLHDLYRTARYSSHELGEPERADAVGALEEISRRLAPVHTP